MSTATHRTKLRRLRLLQTLAQVTPSPMGELSLLARLRADPELEPTVERIRAAITYLETQSLVGVLSVPETDWRAAWLTDAGRHWLQQPGDHGLAIHDPDYLPPSPDNRRGRVSSIDVIDPAAKAWLDQQLIERNFTGYTGLTRALEAKGYQISRSAIHRYGKRYQADLKELRQTVEMAKGFAEVVGDDAGALAQTLTGLAQQEAIAVIRERRFQDEGIELPKLFSSIAQLNKSDIGVKKYAAEVRRKAAAVAEAAVKTLARAGTTRETAEAIKREILGIA